MFRYRRAQPVSDSSGDGHATSWIHLWKNAPNKVAYTPELALVRVRL
jgi:hypothetical protein